MSGRWLFNRAVLLSACLTVSLFGATPGRAQALDDCRLAPTGVPEGARPLSDIGLRNLTAFTRLLGYIRHFHPSDQAAAADWDTLAIEGARRIEPCDTPERLARALETFFRPVAPTVQVFASGVRGTTWHKFAWTDTCTASPLDLTHALRVWGLWQMYLYARSGFPGLRGSCMRARNLLLGSALCLAAGCNSLDPKAEQDGSRTIIPTDARPVVQPLSTPPPISGGTLAVTPGGRFAIIAKTVSCGMNSLVKVSQSR